MLLKNKAFELSTAALDAPPPPAWTRWIAVAGALLAILLALAELSEKLGQRRAPVPKLAEAAYTVRVLSGAGDGAAAFWVAYRAADGKQQWVRADEGGYAIVAGEVVGISDAAFRPVRILDTNMNPMLVARVVK